MSLHLRRRIASLAGFFGLGMITDVGVCLYYRSVSLDMRFMATLLSFLVTLVPFLVAARGISAKRYELFFAYAIGAAAGTWLGMMVSLA